MSTIESKLSEIHAFLSNLHREVNSLEESYGKVLAVLENLETRLEKTADRDDLTGLLRRKPFFREWNTILTKTHELALPDRPCSVLMIDIDRFKNINDTYGHPIGDEVIRRVSKIISNACTERGYLSGRFGGEEFAVIAIGSEAEALEFAESLRGKVESSGAQPGCTISIGLVSSNTAGARQHACNSDHWMIQAADQALYQAKNSGRNRVCKAGLSLLKNTG